MGRRYRMRGSVKEESIARGREMGGYLRDISYKGPGAVRERYGKIALDDVEKEGKGRQGAQYLWRICPSRFKKFCPIRFPKKNSTTPF